MKARVVGGIVLAGLLAGAAYLAWTGREDWDPRVTYTPASLAELSSGARVWVHGEVVTGGAPLIAPMVSQPCLLYALEERQPGETAAEGGRVDAHTQAAPFCLRVGESEAWVEVLPEATFSAPETHQRKESYGSSERVVSWIPWPESKEGSGVYLECESTVAFVTTGGRREVILRAHALRYWSAPGLPKARMIVVLSLALGGFLFGLLGLVLSGPLFRVLRPGAEYGYRLASVGPDDAPEPGFAPHGSGIVLGVIAVPFCLPLLALLAGVETWTGLQIVDISKLEGVLSVPAFLILLGALHDLLKLSDPRRDDTSGPFGRDFWLGAAPVVLLAFAGALWIFQAGPEPNRFYRAGLGFGLALGGLVLGVVAGAISSFWRRRSA